MQNALDPNLMTPAERLREVGEILAAGLLRLKARTQIGGPSPVKVENAAAADRGRKRLLRRRAGP
jgi:hypothetical protein